MRPARLTALLAASAVLGAAAQAHAQGPVEPTVVAGPNAVTMGYLTRTVAIPQGGSLSLLNLDLITHTVTSTEIDGDGFERFGSDYASPGARQPVRGVDKLAPGEYPFICMFHSNLRGTLIVTPNPARGREAGR